MLYPLKKWKQNSRRWKRMSKIKIALIALSIFGLGSITGYYSKPAEIKIVKEKNEDKKWNLF